MLLRGVLQARVDYLLDLDFMQHWIEDVLPERIQQSKRAGILSLQISYFRLTFMPVGNELFGELLDCCFRFDVVPHDVL